MSTKYFPKWKLRKIQALKISCDSWFHFPRHPLYESLILSLLHYRGHLFLCRFVDNWLQLKRTEIQFSVPRTLSFSPPPHLQSTFIHFSSCHTPQTFQTRPDKYYNSDLAVFPWVSFPFKQRVFFVHLALIKSLLSLPLTVLLIVAC